MSVKDNAPETRKALETVDWERAASGRFEEKIDKAHGRIEQRRIEVLTPLPRLINYPHVAQIFPRHPRTHRRKAQRNRGNQHRTRLWHHLGAGGTRLPGTAPRLEPRPLVGRSQSSHPRPDLRRRRLPRPRRFRARQQCHLHQPRARHHHPQDPVRKLRFRDPALRAAAPGRAHGAAVALNPAFPANPRLPVGEPARAPRSPPSRKSTSFAAPLDPANRARESPAAALWGKHRLRSSGNSARRRREAKTGQINSAARTRTAPKPFRFTPALRIRSNPSAIHKNFKAWDTPGTR